MTARRGVILAVPAIALAALLVVIVTGLDGGGRGNGAQANNGRSHGRTVRVARRTLVERKAVDGTLGFAGKRSVTNRLSGTITSLPRIGQIIRPGHTLFRVDGEPVVLMNGTLPAYRTLKLGIDNGADVRQLERGLSALGYSPGIVDSQFTASTAAAVRSWQGDLGLDETGQVELGRVVFLPRARRVTDVKTSLGSAASNPSNAANPGDGMRFVSYTGSGETPTQTTPTETTPTPTQTTPTPTQTTPTPKRKKPTPTPTQTTPAPAPAPAKDAPASESDRNGSDGSSDGNAPATEVLTTTATRRVVTAKIDAADQLLVARGQRVRVELPDGRFVRGRITNVGRVATAESGSRDNPDADTAPKITITIRLRSARAAGRLDQAPVSVQLAHTTRRKVLAVPVQALVARPGGRYALELAGGRLVGVVPGLFANGYVELTGGQIREGDRVRVPE